MRDKTTKEFNEGDTTENVVQPLISHIFRYHSQKLLVTRQDII